MDEERRGGEEREVTDANMMISGKMRKNKRIKWTREMKGIDCFEEMQ